MKQSLNIESVDSMVYSWQCEKILNFFLKGRKDKVWAITVKQANSRANNSLTEGGILDGILGLRKDIGVKLTKSDKLWNSTICSLPISKLIIIIIVAVQSAALKYKILANGTLDWWDLS